LKDRCTTGAYYGELGASDYFDECVKNHYKKNRRHIKKFLFRDGGIILVLGPGPGRDLPLDILVKNCEQLILIDGFIEPMEKWKGSLAADLQKKVIILQRDLTGGFYNFLFERRGEITQALTLDLKISEKQGAVVFDNYTRLLKNYFASLGQAMLDFAQHNAKI